MISVKKDLPQRIVYFQSLYVATLRLILRNRRAPIRSIRKQMNYLMINTEALTSNKRLMAGPP